MHFKLHIPIYGSSLFCIFGKGKYAKKILKKQISKKKLRRWEFKGSDGMAAMYGNSAFLWMKDLPTTPSSMGTLAHECNHILNFISRYIGLTRDDNAEEAQSYLVGYITEKIYEEINNSNTTGK